MAIETEFHFARITLEARAPLMIGSGHEDALADVLLARDVNGLPVLPATSIAGVLRHRFRPEEARAFFGFQDAQDGHASPLTFTDGLFHWQDDRPRDGIVFDPEDFKDDPFVEIGKRDHPVRRDHVRLNERGTVEGDGKFERSAAPAGSRFTFEITQRGDGGALDAVLAEVEKGLWLGGATRSGYGEMTCIARGRETLDLGDAQGRKRYVELMAQDLGSRDIEMCPVDAAEAAGWMLQGRIEGPLLVGAASDAAEYDRVPYREAAIVWSDDGPQIREVVVVPASAIKGALRHRTLFHLRRQGHGAAREAIDVLFGSATDGGGGQAGMLRFCDAVVAEPKHFKMTHVGIDRFTAGSRRGVLFTDQALWRPELTIRILPLEGFPDTDCSCRNAFKAALADLATGRLGLGADWGDGLGVFKSLTLPEELKEGAA